MGFWGTSLYANDCTCDLRDDYKRHLCETSDDDEALKRIIIDYQHFWGTDEEALIWFALADTQWRLGRLSSEVKEKAIYWINHDGGMLFWEDSPKKGKAWKKTLEQLRVRLCSPQPAPKHFRPTVPFKTNPWNVGDIYAYRFHTDTAKENGYCGKYILLQKLKDQSYLEGRTLSCIRAFNTIFEEVPGKIELDHMRELPFDVAERFMPDGKHRENPKLNMCAVLEIKNKREYPEKNLFYIGTYPVPEQLPTCIRWTSTFFWGSIEQTLLFYHEMWQNYSYQLEDNQSIVTQLYSVDLPS